MLLQNYSAKARPVSKFAPVQKNRFSGYIFVNFIVAQKQIVSLEQAIFICPKDEFYELAYSNRYMSPGRRIYKVSLSAGIIDLR